MDEAAWVGTEEVEVLERWRESVGELRLRWLSSWDRRAAFSSSNGADDLCGWLLEAMSVRLVSCSGLICRLIVNFPGCVIYKLQPGSESYENYSLFNFIRRCTCKENSNLICFPHQFQTKSIPTPHVKTEPTNSQPPPEIGIPNVQCPSSSWFPNHKPIRWLIYIY